MNRVQVLGVGFDPVDMDGAVARALALMARGGARVCTPNPEIVMLARSDPALREAIASAELVLADGVGILWASRRLGTPLPARVPGYDFLLALLGKMRGSIYVLGGRPGVAEAAARAVESRFPGVNAVGWHHGYFTDEAPVTAQIAAARPDLLLVCLGGGRQELWMRAHRELPVGLMAGLGGAADVLSGRVRRAPRALRALGLEWLWRLAQNPRERFSRQKALWRFALAVRREARDGRKSGI